MAARRQAPAASFGIRDEGRSEFTVMFAGGKVPAPNAYDLPPVVGKEGHSPDSRRTTNPAFSMPGRAKEAPVPYKGRLWSSRARGNYGPGPCDTVSGPASLSARSLSQPRAPGWSMGAPPPKGKGRVQLGPPGPGPAAYKPNTPQHLSRAAKYSMKGRAKESPMPVSNSDPKTLWSQKGQEETPVGPGEYNNLPKSYAPKYSMQGRAKESPTPVNEDDNSTLWSAKGRKMDGPSPQDYDDNPLLGSARVQSTKESVPRWSMTGRAKETPTPTTKDLWSAREKPKKGPSPAEYPIQRWPPAVAEAKVKIYHPSVNGGSSPTASGKAGGNLTSVAE